MRFYVLPRIRDFIFITVFFIGVLLIGPDLFNGDGDLGRHITVGSYILQSGGIPTLDIFSHTMNGQPFTPHEWLAEVIFAYVYQIAGLNGVVILTALILALAYTLLYNQLIKQNTNIFSAMTLTFLAILASRVHFLARPHIFTILFLSLWSPMVIALARGENKKAVYLAPLMMWLWGNTHGAYVAGLIVLAILLVAATWEWAQKRGDFATVKLLAFAGLGSFIALLINPAGINLLKTSFGYVQSKFLVDHTEEYLSPNFHDSRFMFFLLYLLVMIYGFSRSSKRLTLSEGLLATAWVAMSLYSVRNIPLLTIVVTPLIASTLQPAAEANKLISNLGARLKSIEAQLRGVLWPIMSVTLVVAASFSGVFGSYNSYDSDAFPVQAMDWVEANPQSGNMFNYFTWGGYILHREWPQYLVFIDGQTDFYGETLSREYLQVIATHDGWEEVLNKYEVDWAIIPVQGPLSAALKENGWREIYQDGTAIILRK